MLVKNVFHVTYSLYLRKIWKWDAENNIPFLRWVLIFSLSVSGSKKCYLCWSPHLWPSCCFTEYLFWECSAWCLLITSCTSHVFLLQVLKLSIECANHKENDTLLSNDYLIRNYESSRLIVYYVLTSQN